MRLLILSDVHYACDAEKARRGHEAAAIGNPFLRTFARLYRRHIWLDDPLAWNHLLDRVLNECPTPDLAVANGDFSVDTAFIGVCDDAACQSALECLGKLRAAYPRRFHATIGDHELGKMSLFGGRGGPRHRSLQRTVDTLGIPTFWRLEIDHYVLLGVTSTLLSLPLFHPELLPEEADRWERSRNEHLDAVRHAFEDLRNDQRVLFFCHDPGALPFLFREAVVRRRLPQIETTIIGHLHTQLIFKTSRLLSGMPVLRGMGQTARRLSSALREARCWREFKVRLCPSLSGSELLKDGGYFTAELGAASQPTTFQFHPLPR